MSIEFTEEDYIQSFKYQYRINGSEAYLPEGFRHLLDLANLNGRLLWRGFLPFEQEEWQKLPADIRKADGTNQIELLQKANLLRDLSLVTVNGKSHH